MNKYLICTRADNNIAEMCAISHPLIRDYATLCKADFMVLDKPWHDKASQVSNGRWHYAIIYLSELLQHYERILHLDSDIIIKPRCPNIFDEVPYHSIGTVLEDKGSRQKDRWNRLQLIQREFGSIGLFDKYVNSGVFLVSNIHAGIFQSIDGKYWSGLGYDDNHLSYQIHKLGFPIYELHWKWNFMSLFAEKEWGGIENLNEAYIFHAAGHGFTWLNKDKIEQLRIIRKKWYGY